MRWCWSPNILHMLSFFPSSAKYINGCTSICVHEARGRLRDPSQSCRMRTALSELTSGRQVRIASCPYPPPSPRRRRCRAQASKVPSLSDKQRRPRNALCFAGIASLSGALEVNVSARLIQESIMPLWTRQHASVVMTIGNLWPCLSFAYSFISLWSKPLTYSPVLS